LRAFRVRLPRDQRLARVCCKPACEESSARPRLFRQ
jgi:hypothetical protein